MKKLFLLVGFAAGFIAGSKAGSGPYDQLESKVRSLAKQMDINGAADAQADSGMSQSAAARSYPDIADPMGGVVAPSAAGSKP
jgi:hypothetical protein